MHQNLSRIIAGAALLAAAAFAGLPAMATEATQDDDAFLVATTATSGPTSAAQLRAWNDPGTLQAPLSNNQYTGTAVEMMARRLLRDEDANHPGEDMLGSGTSITH